MDKFEETQEITIPNIAERWRQQYETGGHWGSTYKGDSRLVHQQLMAATSLDEVDEIIGNDSWTRHRCDCCNKATRDSLIIITGGDGYTSALLCKNGLKAMLKQLKESTK